MNQGMKPYYTYETIDLETAGSLSLNLAYNVKEYFFSIPLLKIKNINIPMKEEDL